jgi:hypothetical protein
LSNAAGLSQFVALLIASIAFSALCAGAAIVRCFRDDSDRRLVGWASTWSSRAPPFFS